MSIEALISRVNGSSNGSSTANISSEALAQSSGANAFSPHAGTVEMTEAALREPFSNPDFIVMPDGSRRTDFVVFEDGSVYIGEMQSGKPHGAGFLRPYFKSRYYDSGTFQNGKLWTGGRYFDTHVPTDDSNRKTDWFILPGGKVYVGELKEGKPHGDGVLKPDAEALYRQEGVFKEGELWNGRTYIPQGLSKAVGGYVYTKNGEVEVSCQDCQCVIL